MCVLIIEGKLPNGAIEAGIDIQVQPNGQTTDSDFILKNSGKGKHFSGGPECVCRGKTVTALVRWHESASITSEIVVEMLQTLDEMELIPRVQSEIRNKDFCYKCRVVKKAKIVEH